ncbi:MAG: MBL fold metallo-hydrolase [Thermoanaerobaculia bacterium]
MSNRLVLLGTGTCQLQRDRMASAALVELDELTVVYDFGRGVATRLVELGMRQNEIEHVILSHFHPDHFSDLIPYLHGALYSQIDPRTTDLHVYGPKGLEDLGEKLLDLAGFGELEEEMRPFAVHLHEIDDDKLTIDGRDFDYRDLPPAGNHGLRFDFEGGTYALTGDSHFHEQEIEFLRGVDLGVLDAGHLEKQEIFELAVASEAERLVCSHLYQELDEVELNARAREAGFEGKLLVGYDFMTFRLGKEI